MYGIVNLGDIVEAHVSFQLLKTRGKRYKFMPVLRAIAILETSLSEVRVHEIKMRQDILILTQDAFFKRERSNHVRGLLAAKLARYSLKRQEIGYHSQDEENEATMTG